MKGVILHGGYGTKLRPLTHTGLKQLIPVANKPVSQYVLEDLKNSNITEIAIVLGNLYPEKVKEHYGDGSEFGVEFTTYFRLCFLIGTEVNFSTQQISTSYRQTIGYETPD
ncbi:MAG: sugar phosphate nucleotidyltransferase [Candidatus Heimdallarchaeota archaeon]